MNRDILAEGDVNAARSVPADAIPWIVSAERAQTRERRIDDTRDMRVSGAGIDSKAIAARKAAE